MNNGHGSFLAPFFEKMNGVFPDKWCVLHSYETLPYYSASDVDMAFSGSNIKTLEKLIKKVADETNWTLLQKLWYDVENCYYYVLRHNESDTLLAIDFLIDNEGIGKYGFTTKVLTKECVLINECFPVPNPETALCYKLVKRIVKKRSIEEDESYLASQYDTANKEKVNAILARQFGKNGKEPILRYLSDKNKTLTTKDIILLHKIRKKRISSFSNRFNYFFWELRRMLYRVFFPSGMVLSVPNMDAEKLRYLKKELEKKVGILFRFVQLNETDSKTITFKGFVGSTLVICPKEHLERKLILKATWASRNTFHLDLSLSNGDVGGLADHYFSLIVEALATRIRNKRMPNGR